MYWDVALWSAGIWAILSLAAGQLTEKEKSTIVDMHNKLRSQVTPSAAFMQKVVWNETLRAVAEAYATKCIWKHNPDLKKLFLGENLFITTGAFNATEATVSWFDENVDYNYENKSCPTNKMCGHYTQMVWANTNRIGCATHFCETVEGLSFKKATILVCNYDPPGNFRGQNPYVSGEPCSKCPENLPVCEEKICVRENPLHPFEEPGVTVDPTVLPERDVTEDSTVLPERDVTENPIVLPERDVTEDSTVLPEQDVTKNPIVLPERDVTEDSTVLLERDVTEDSTVLPERDVTVDPTVLPERDVTEDSTVLPERDVTENPIVLPERDVTENPIVLPERDVTEDSTVLPEQDVTKNPIVLPERDVTEDSTVLPERDVTEDLTVLPERSHSTTEPVDVPRESTRVPVRVHVDDTSMEKTTKSHGSIQDGQR